jgi:DNA repair photolyase
MSTRAHKGRGAVSALPGRFASTRVESDEPPPERAPATQLRATKAAGIISRNRSPDIPFDLSINPYQGCEHGCVYCYARPSHSYLDLSPGLDFETRIFYKPNAVALLLDAWSKPAYRCQPIAIGANTDPYQPAEKELGITRSLLETFLEYRHPVSLITKGGLMARDIDLLAELAGRNLVGVAISVPTMSNDLKRVLEPRVPAAAVRFRLMSDLASAGVPVSVLVAPVIPAVNDAEIESILESAAEHGADHASWIMLRLPHELKQLFRDWLSEHMPERAAHVMSLVQQASGGRDYDNRFGLRQRGRGPYADMIRDRFSAACRRFGLGHGRARRALDCSQFRRPGQQQMALDFD